VALCIVLNLSLLNTSRVQGTLTSALEHLQTSFWSFLFVVAKLKANPTILGVCVGKYLSPQVFRVLGDP